MKKQIRIVIDTNIWISFLIGKTLANLTEHIINDNIKILFSNELLNELVEVVHRPKFKKYFSQESIQELLLLIDTKVEHIKVTNKIQECRDIKDNFLLNLCVDGAADFLITGDDDLLSLNPFQSTKIIYYRDFERILKEM